jgi:RNA polymerase sigma factor (sigma-70 family)
MAKVSRCADAAARVCGGCVYASATPIRRRSCLLSAQATLTSSPLARSVRVRVVSGEHDFEAIWRDEGPSLWRAVLVYSGGRRDIADDAVAEAFARTIERGDTVRDPIAYLYRIAFRLAAGDLQRLARQAPVEDRGVTDVVDDVDLLRALRELSPDQRAAVFLRYRADLPVARIAELLGTSSAAIRVRLLRGRRRLASLLGEDEAR